jgi:hypothetical protein
MHGRNNLGGTYIMGKGIALFILTLLGLALLSYYAIADFLILL